MIFFGIRFFAEYIDASLHLSLLKIQTIPIEGDIKNFFLFPHTHIMSKQNSKKSWKETHQRWSPRKEKQELNVNKKLKICQQCTNYPPHITSKHITKSLRRKKIHFQLSLGFLLLGSLGHLLWLSISESDESVISPHYRL